MPLTDRDLRKLINTKQSSIEFQGKPSINGMVDGQVAIEKKSNSQLALYRKKYGKLWKMYMSSDGNQYVDKTLRTNTLEYTHKFIDYRVFSHNFEEDIATTKYYMPWMGTKEVSSGMDEATVAFITPFKMILHKIIIRCGNLTASQDVTIRVEKTGNDATEAVVATALYDVSDTTNYGTIYDDTNFELVTSDFDNAPSVDAGIKTGLSIQATGGDVSGATCHWWVTSVWRIEVVI